MSAMKTFAFVAGGFALGIIANSALGILKPSEVINADHGGLRTQHSAEQPPSGNHVAAKPSHSPAPTASGPMPYLLEGSEASSFAPSVNFTFISGRSAAARLYTLAGHDHLAADDLPGDNLAPLTQFAQRWIYESQHPSDCASKTFLVSLGHVRGNGIGSILHVSGSHLSAALERGWVFTWADTAGEEWTDPKTCAAIEDVPGGPAPRRNWECHFKPPTHCSRSLLRSEKKREKNDKGEDVERTVGLNYHMAEMHHGAGGLPSNWVPAELAKRYRALRPHASDDELKYWWRGQSVTYLMRFNKATVATVAALRFDPGRHLLFPNATRPETASEVPFPQGVIHSHVRHGDKYTEMKLQGTGRYFEAGANISKLHPWFLSRFMFVSTEDPEVLTQAQWYTPGGFVPSDKQPTAPTGGGGPWSVIYTDIQRSNRGPLAQVEALGTDNAGFTTRTHLLQLTMSLECDAWIGTRGSNWNRLLDELRCTWVDKCNRPYVEVGTDESWEHYNWLR